MSAPNVLHSLPPLWPSFIIFPPSLPEYVKQILSSIIIHLIIQCHALLSQDSLSFHLSLSSIVQPMQFSPLSYPWSMVLPPIHLSIIIFSSTHRSSLKSSFLHPHLHACHFPMSTSHCLSHPSSIIFYLFVAQVSLYTIDKVAMPLHGNGISVSHPSSWLSWVCQVYVRV